MTTNPLALQSVTVQVLSATEKHDTARNETTGTVLYLLSFPGLCVHMGIMLRIIARPGEHTRYTVHTTTVQQNIHHVFGELYGRS